MWRYLVRNQRPTSSTAGETSTQDRDESPSVEQETHGNEDAQEQQETHETTVETVEEVRRPSVIDTRRDEIKRKYEATKRSRKFNQNRKKSFPWVTLTNDKMFCSTCLSSGMLCDKESKFVKGGCGNFHIKALQTHLASERHKRCAEHQEALAATPGTNPAERALEAMNHQDFEKMRKLFRISHSVAKKGRPFIDYIWSVDLHEVTHGISLGKTYRNDSACRIFVGYIAETERIALAEAIKKAPFYSVLTDGSTDSSVREAEAMYVRYSNHGKISNKFLALKNIPHANAENVTNLIETTLKEYGGLTDENLYQKLVGFGADGASVNMGSHSGIGARLQRKQPLLTSVHCMAHRLELAFKQVIQENEAKLKVLALLENLYKFYHNSSLNQSMLRECAAAFCTSGIPARLGGTRWIPHTYNALVNFWKMFPALQQHLGEVCKNIYGLIFKFHFCT